MVVKAGKQRARQSLSRRIEIAHDLRGAAYRSLTRAGREAYLVAMLDVFAAWIRREGFRVKGKYIQVLGRLYFNPWPYPIARLLQEVRRGQFESFWPPGQALDHYRLSQIETGLVRVKEELERKGKQG